MRVKDHSRPEKGRCPPRPGRLTVHSLDCGDWLAAGVAPAYTPCLVDSYPAGRPGGRAVGTGLSISRDLSRPGPFHVFAGPTSSCRTRHGSRTDPSCRHPRARWRPRHSCRARALRPWRHRKCGGLNCPTSPLCFVISSPVALSTTEVTVKRLVNQLTQRLCWPARIRRSSDEESSKTVEPKEASYCKIRPR